MYNKRIPVMLVLVLSLLLIMSGCKKKSSGPETPPPAPATPQSPSTDWTPEKRDEGLKVETTADYFNKQGDNP